MYAMFMLSNTTTQLNHIGKYCELAVNYVFRGLNNSVLCVNHIKI